MNLFAEVSVVEFSACVESAPPIATKGEAIGGAAPRAFDRKGVGSILFRFGDGDRIRTARARSGDDGGSGDRLLGSLFHKSCG